MSILDSFFQLLFGRRPTTTTAPRTPPPPPRSPPAAAPPPPPRTPPAPPPPVAASPPAAPPPPPASPPASPPPVATPPTAPSGGGASPGPDYLATLKAQTRTTLTRADFEQVASHLGCEWEAVAAVAKVESGRLGGFGSDDRPIILYERHLFSRSTNHQYDATHPNISNPSAGGYPPTQAERWAQMAEAYALDPEAALKSASYGRFQVLGRNFTDLGMANAHAYVSKLAKSEKDQLEAFEGFIKANNLKDELQRKDWAGFARGYNGPNFAVNKYDEKMATAYNEVKADPSTIV